MTFPSKEFMYKSTSHIRRNIHSHEELDSRRLQQSYYIIDAILSNNFSKRALSVSLFSLTLIILKLYSLGGRGDTEL